MNKEIYERTGLVITEFDVEDVITTSAVTPVDDSIVPCDIEGSVVI